MSTRFSGLQLADDAGYFQGFWSRMFGSFMASGREKAGLTVEQAAVLAGMDPAEWSAIEAGDQLPKTRQQLQLMAMALELDWATMAQVVCLCSGAWGVK